MRAGTPLPSSYVRLTMAPGPFGATMMTSTEGGGTICPKWILNPWENMRQDFAFRFGWISVLYTAAWCSSGRRIWTMSAFFTASFTARTSNPSSFARSQLFPGRRPIITESPLSRRFRDCPRPCEP